MDKKYLDSIEKIKAFVHNEKDVMGALILGSQVRKELPGDQWSDLDILILVNDVSKFSNNEEWTNHFGSVVCISNEITNLSWIKLIWYVKRILYNDNRTIEFSIEPYNRIDDVLNMNKEIHALGYEIIYDRTNNDFTSKVKNSITTIIPTEKKNIVENEFYSIINDLLFHIIYAIKKIKRGELWVAVC